MPRYAVVDSMLFQVSGDHDLDGLSDGSGAPEGRLSNPRAAPLSALCDPSIQHLFFQSGKGELSLHDGERIT